MHTNKSEPIFHNISWSILLTLVFIWGIYLINSYNNDVLYKYFALSYNSIDQKFEYYRFLTYGFLHSDIKHIIFNSIWLLIFGHAIIRHISLTSYFIILILGIIAGGGMAHFFLLGQPNNIMVGISGGVSALLGAALRFIIKTEYDFNQRPLLFHFFDIRHLVLLCFFIFFDFISSFLQHIFYGNNISWQAHITGLIIGSLLMSLSSVNGHKLYRQKK